MISAFSSKDNEIYKKCYSHAQQIVIIPCFNIMT